MRVATIKHITAALSKADDSPEGRADKIVAALSLSDLDDLSDLTPEMQDAFKAASEGILGQLEINLDGDLVNRVSDSAVAFAKARAAELVTQIDDATRNELRDLIAGGLSDNLTSAQIADLIQEGYSFSAHGHGALSGMKQARDAGVNLKKEWYPDPDPCPICEENADAGPIDVDDQFPSGDDAPYAHPHCECNLITVEIKDDEDGEEN